MNQRISRSIRTELTKLAPNPWLPEPRSIVVELLATGVYHVNFLVRSGESRFVARCVRSSQWGSTPRDQIIREFAVLTDLVGSGAAPRPLALALECETPFLIESFVEGRRFQPYSDYSLCAEAIAAAHACAPRASASLLDRTPPQDFLTSDGLTWIERAARAGGESDTTQLLRAAHAELIGREFAVDGCDVLIHTDLTASNIIQTPHGCVLIDWEGARIGPRAWDLAYFLSPVTKLWAAPESGFDDDDRSQFIASYAAATGTDPAALTAEVESLLPYVIFRALGWCAAYAQGTETKPSAVVRALTRLTSAGFVEEQLLARIC